MKLRKLLALTTALAMLMSMATTAFAVNGGTTGEGEVEFVYNVNVFQVVLPTVSENDTTYDFRLDPMGAIAATNGGALDAGFTAATMYFANVDENNVVVSYSDTSDAKTIINKSSFDVTVTVEATLDTEELGGAVLVDGYDDAKFGDEAERAEIALGVVYTVGEDTETVYLIDGDATVTMDIEAIENAYVVTYDDETGKYSYNLNSSLAPEDFNSMDIQLTGLCNDHDAWSDLGEIAPEVELVWSVVPADEDIDYDEVNGDGSGSNVTYPRLSNDTTYNRNGQVVPNAQRQVLINLGDSGITSVRTVTVVGVKDLSTTGCARNVSDGVATLTFHADVLSTYVGKTILVTFGNSETLEFVLGAAN